METPLHLLPIDRIVAGHVAGEFSIEETVESCTNRIEEVNDLYNAVVWSDPTFIKGEIDRAHSQRASGDDFPLLGVPILVKECDSAIEGIPNSWGNQRMKDIGYCDIYTSTSITLLRQAGAVIVGKTNNPEFALTITTESSAHGYCNNPLDVARNAGGSSGGAAASVASGMVNVATASDGGGSTRAPASNCGLFGFKPSRGQIPLGPLYSEAWDGLVCKGLIASNMSDLVRVFDVQAHQKFHPSLSSVPQRLRIGVRTEGFGSFYPMDPNVVGAVEKAANFLSMSGHDVESAHPTSYDNTSFIASFMDILSYNSVLDFKMLQQMVNSAMNIDECEEVTQWFYHEGLKVTESDHNNALAAKRSFTDSVDEWFEDFDILITPTCGNVAPLHNEVQKDPDIAPFIYGGLCFPSNVAGTPALSVPVETSHPSGLPVGLQIIAARGNDELALRLATFLETDYSDLQVTVPNNITS